MRPTTFRFWLLVLLAAGLVARLVAAQHRLARPLQGDELSYDSIAINVAEGRGYSVGTPADFHPTALRGPGYVLPLAASYRVFGHRPLPVLVVQALLDVLAAWLISRLARRWFADPRIALVATALYVAYPPFVSSTTLVLSETLCQFLVVAGVYAFFEFLHARRLAWLVASGVALGLCALSKPHFAAIGIVLALASIPVLHPKGALRAAAIHTAIIALVLAPWVVRNYAVFHAFVPGVTLGGVALWLGAGPYGGQPIGSSEDPAIPDSVRARYAAMDEIEQNRWATQEGLRVIAADPVQALQLGVQKTARLWFNLGYPGTRPSRPSLLVAAFNACMIALAVYGARLRPTPPAAAALVGLGIFWTLVHAPFYTVLRYAFPFYALLFVFSAAGLVAMTKPR